jgi:hypothetical protein
MTRNLPLAPEVFEKALKRLMEMVMVGMTHMPWSWTNRSAMTPR